MGEIWEPLFSHRDNSLPPASIYSYYCRPGYHQILMKKFMSKHSLCAHIAIQLDMVRSSAQHMWEACYILPHAAMKRGGLKVLHGNKETGREK